MKKIISFILVLIIILAPLNIVRATEAIELTQASFDLLNNGVDLLSYSGSVPYGFLPFVFSSEKNYQTVLEDMMQKEDVFVIDGNANIQIRPLTENEYGLLENAYVYDDDGNIVSLQQLYYGEVDNGYFTEKFYCKNDGSIVYQDQAKSNPYIDVKFGGSELSYLDWENAYNTLSSDLSNNQYHYSLDGSTVGNVTYFAGMGQSVGGQPGYAISIFVANQYQPGLIVPMPNNGNRIMGWYTNDLSLIHQEILLGSPSSPWTFHYSTGDYVVNGYHYQYQGTWWNNTPFMPDTPNNTWENWSSGINVGYGCFASSGVIPNNSLLNENVVSYQKVLNNSDSIDFSKPYSISSLSDYMDTIENVETIPSSSYDYTSAISDINYPYIFDIDTSISDVVIPFPDSVVIDDTPAIDYPLEDTIDPSLLTPNIPIISDLKNKFPFSIPWDIASIISGLEAERETPYIDTEITIPGINYTWVIQYDLSDFDDTAALFRTLFLIAFILGLAYFSYDHFFGS